MVLSESRAREYLRSGSLASPIGREQTLHPNQSGAALNILEPLYDACLDRMQGFVDDLDRSEERHSPHRFQDFRETLAAVEAHPNREYFILKSISLNNLYGFDIMEEAV